LLRDLHVEWWRINAGLCAIIFKFVGVLHSSGGVPTQPLSPLSSDAQACRVLWHAAAMLVTLADPCNKFDGDSQESPREAGLHA
jgi:hypothetical protein